LNGNDQKVGSRITRGMIVIAIGLAIWFSPVPVGVKPQAWQLLAIFIATIFGLILSPLPMGAVVIIGVMMTTLTGILKIGPALSGFSNSTVWLIVAALLVARGLLSTGLGRRISFLFIRPKCRPGSLLSTSYSTRLFPPKSQPPQCSSSSFCRGDR